LVELRLALRISDRLLCKWYKNSVFAKITSFLKLPICSMSVGTYLDFKFAKLTKSCVKSITNIILFPKGLAKYS
jgi:hypothetical protein